MNSDDIVLFSGHPAVVSQACITYQLPLTVISTIPCSGCYVPGVSLGTYAFAEQEELPVRTDIVSDMLFVNASEIVDWETFWESTIEETKSDAED